MSTPQIPVFGWVESDGEIESSARGAWEIRTQIYPSQSGLGVADEDSPWSSDPSNISGPNPLTPPRTYDWRYPPEPDQNPFFVSRPADDSRMSTPSVLPELLGFHGDISAGLASPWSGFGGPLACHPSDIPPTPRLNTIPLPPVDPWFDNWGHIGDGDDGGRGWDENPLGSRYATREYTDTLAQEVASMSLAPAGLNVTENNNWSEHSSRPAQSRSRGDYDRTQSNEERRLCLAQICTVMRIPLTEDVDEVPTLRGIIERLGGTVPQPLPAGWLSEADRQAVNLRERRECFEELRRLVCSSINRVTELEILQNVLAVARMNLRVSEPQGPGGEHQPYGAYRHWSRT